MKRRAVSRTKRIWSLDYASIGRSPLRYSLVAEVWINDGGEVTAEWHNDTFKAEIERHGIAVAAGIFKPADGALFFDNLDLAYSLSTTIHVESIRPSGRRSRRR